MDKLIKFLRIINYNKVINLDRLINVNKIINFYKINSKTTFFVIVHIFEFFRIVFIYI